MGSTVSHAAPVCEGMRPPAMDCTAGASASITTPGSNPARTQSAHIAIMAAREKRSVSCAASASGPRGRPR